MAKNIWFMGSQTLSGNFGRIHALGELNINNTEAKKIYSIGEMTINDSSIEKIRTIGEVEIQNSKFKDVKVIGEVDINGVCKVDTLIITGEMKADLLECNILRNGPKSRKRINGLSGILSYTGSYKGETFENLYPLKLDSDFEFSNILSAEKLIYHDVLECERFYSFSELELEGVNAEFIYINPLEKSMINNLMGSKIIISDNWKGDSDFNRVPKTMSNSYYLKHIKESASAIFVSQIEGDSIYLDNLKADLVSGIDVVIGDNCEIEKVEYSSKVKISKKSRVNEVFKNE